MLFNYEFLVTNLYSTRIEDVFNTYHNRGVVENSIKEIKDGFFMNKTDSHSFQINSVRMMLSALAFNIIQSMKRMVLPTTESCRQINTLRIRLFRIPAKIIQHARSKIIQLSKYNVYDSLFWNVLDQIQQTWEYRHSKINIILTKGKVCAKMVKRVQKNIKNEPRLEIHNLGSDFSLFNFL